MSLEQEVREKIEELVAEDAYEALSLLTGCFVGMAIAVVEQRGNNPDNEIVISGEGNPRSITIHAVKSKIH